MLDGWGWPAGPARIESRIGMPTKAWVVEVSAVSAVSVGVGNRPEGAPPEVLLGGLLRRLLEGFVDEMATRLPDGPITEVLDELMLRLFGGNVGLMARLLDEPITRLFKRLLWILLEGNAAEFSEDEEEPTGELICDAGALPEVGSPPLED